jgi:1-acyl-sn-glycerol-3-phosphate acyltransferase
VRGLLDAARTLWRRQERPAPLDAWGKDVELARTLRPLAELLYERYWRVQTTGIENVPSGPCILVANHAGALPLDGPVLHLALRRERPELRESRWLLEEQALAAPFIGLLANRLGAVRSTPENAQRLLAEGRPLIIFPEGAYGPGKPFGERYQLRRFGRGGYLKVALREGVPVVPVAIVGSEESSPVLARLPLKLLGFDELPLTLPPLPARWHLRFGPSVDLQGRPADPEGDPLWVEEKNLEVREQIASMITELLAQRSHVF